MKRTFGILAMAAALLAWTSSAALGQGSTTSTIGGTVVDAQGGAVPGATIVVKNTATGVTYQAVSSSQGTFSIPALPTGMYSVTVSLSGFNTVVLNDIALNAGVPVSIKPVLEVGGIAQTVIVEGATPIVQTQASAVAATINTKQIMSLPLTSRNVLDFITFLPGVNTPGGNRDSTINGLPQSAINITLDGVNVQDNTLKTGDGFFTIVQPRLDSIEEVTVTGAAHDAAGAGQGAVQIRFVTRQGTNTYNGSFYHYFRHDALNQNTWFNKRNKVAKPKLLQNQAGGRVGGPILIPGVFDGRGKAFFFQNWEEFIQPQQLTRNRVVLHPNALTGNYRYLVAGGVQEVNVLAVAAENGQLSTMDPTVQKLLADIRAATLTAGVLLDQADPMTQQYSFNVDQRAHNRFPTTRVDVNLTPGNRLSTVVNYHSFSSVPDTLNNRDPRFPGFPATGTQTSKRYQVSSTLRSTVSGDLVNEGIVGYSGAPVQFFSNMTIDMFKGSVANQDGFLLNINNASGITNASNTAVPQARNASTWLLEDTLTWLRGNHSLGMGGSFTQVDLWMDNQTLIPTVNFGVLTGDPAFGMFNTVNFPGASQTQLNAARAFYAVLTGRASSITGNARLDENTNKYAYMGKGTQRGRMRDVGLFIQDSWRIRSNLTLNLGLRYELQFPFYSRNDSFATASIDDAWGVTGNKAGCDPARPAPDACNLFKPGVLTGRRPQFVQLTSGTKAYSTDWDNIAPSVGFNWTPGVPDGWRPVLGESGDFAIRGGWARSFQRNGMSDFTGVYGRNPGLLINVNRTEALGNLGPLPLLFRDKSRLEPPPFPEAPVYPAFDVVDADLGTFAPNLQVPYADTWSIGVQRGISRNMAVEVRYLGTRSRDQFLENNLNEVNIHENGFFNEFKVAMANLQSHVAAGCGAAGAPACSFAYRGPGSGTNPLPIFLAYLSRSTDVANPAAYTGTSWTSSTFINPMARQNPLPFSAANALLGNATFRGNGVAAGRPVNFFVVNPDLLGGAFVTGNGGYTKYHSLQVELRRRLANGLQFQSSYVFGHANEGTRYSFRSPLLDSRQTGSEGEVTHAFKANWVYELPFGQGKRWGSNVSGLVDRIVGGWQFHGNARVQTGRLVNFGNVRMVNFNRDELWDMYRIRFDENRRVWMLPQEVIDNTVRAFSVSATSPTGYGALGPPTGRYFAPASGPDCIESIHPNFGQCGTRQLVLRGPVFREIDISVMKVVRVQGRTYAEIRFEMLNAFNNVNYVPVTGIGSNPANYEVTGLTGTNTARVVQIVTRFTW